MLPNPFTACRTLGGQALQLAVSAQRSQTLSPFPQHAPRQVRGVIFASGLRREVFTAGNDIKELFAPLTSQERYT